MTQRRIALGELTAAGELELSAAIDAARLACFPTDTVYGIGGALNETVIAGVIAAKGRHDERPLQVVFPRIGLLLDATTPEPRLRAAILRLLPGALTLVIPYPEGFPGPPPGRGRDGRPTLGVRVPDWPAPMAAMSRLPRPLVASSANPSGALPPARPEDVAPSIIAACHLLLDGGPAGGLASTVVDLSDYQAGRWAVLREGAVSHACVATALADAQGG